MPLRRFEVRIHDAGTVFPTDLTVDFTISNSRLTVPPDFGGQTVRPLEGKAELLPYSITVVDDDGWLTANLFSGGRPVIVGRLAEVRMDTDGQGFTQVDVRRVAAVRGGSSPEYRLELSDERWIGRGNRLFEANTTLQLVPQMPAAPWFLLAGGERTDPLATEEPGLVRSVSGSFLLVQSGGPRIDPEMRRVGLEEDVIDNPAPSNTLGNFQRLQFEDENGLLHPVVSFSTLAASTKEDVLGLDWKVEPDGTPPIMPDFWVYWPLHGFSVGQNVGPWRLLWPDGLPTTPTTPYLVGKAEDTAYPLSEFLSDILDGDYGGTALRYDPPSVDALRNLGGADGNWWVVTGAVDRDEFLAELYRAHLIVPFTRADGTIAPRQIVPESVDSSGLFVLDRTTVQDPGITWENSGRELANAFQLTRLQARTVSRVFGSPLRSVSVSPIATPLQTHSGIPDTRATYGTDREQVMTAGRAADVLDDFLTPLFDLAGDGAQVGTATLVPQPTEVPQPGDIVIVDLDDLRGPNPGAAARSGRRAAVILERRRVWQQDAAVEVRFWDLGPSLNTSVAHADAEAHDDFHDDAAHLDGAHSDAAHVDDSHGDTHLDSSHSDVAHTDVAHLDHDDSHSDSHLDHTDGVHADDHSDHSDAGLPTHDDTTHEDSPHGDTSHADSHTDDAHSDSPHGDAAHGDAAHDDAHGDGPHIDSPHGDLPHGDAHDDIAHGDDIHGDAAHGDSPHDDQPHEDHDDAHSDTHLDHTDGIHGDDHADHDDVNIHDDVTHDDATHADSNHSDQAHADHPESAGHDDVTHKDDAHDDGHTDVPHNDLAA